MKYIVTLMTGLLLSAASFADEAQDQVEKDMVEVVVTAEKISESTEKPQVADEEVQGCDPC